MIYSIGDRVRIKTDACLGILAEDIKNHAKQVGTIQKITDIRLDDTNPYITGDCRWKESELEPVTKSLEELEVGGMIYNGINKLQIKEIRKSFVVKYTSGCCEVMELKHLEDLGYYPYTPKKITVFKHKGKRYPVSDIIKKVKSL